MIDRWLHLTPAIEQYVASPNPMTLNCDGILKVSKNDVVDGIRSFLAFFNVTQETLACEKTPTLSFVLPSFEDLLGALHQLHDDGIYPNLMHAISASIKKLEKYRQEC
jgi:hypothetical protein